MKAPNDKPLKKQEKKNKAEGTEPRDPFFPDRTLKILQGSKNPLFQSAHLAWVIVKRKEPLRKS
jgi:hypothetical protein